MSTKRPESIVISFIIILCILKRISSGETVDLPLCPSNIQYLPQNLPMHCRMPANMSFGSYPGFPTMQKIAYSMPTSNGNMPNMAPMAMPGGVPAGFPAGYPASIMSPSLPIPMPAPGPKIPVIVMPFYAPDKSYSGSEPKQPPGKPKPNFPSDTESSNDEEDTDDSDSDGSSDGGWWRGMTKKKKKLLKKKKATRRMYRRMSRRHHGRKRNLLTPVLQYVTKDGYVIFEKRISKPEAKQWLEFDKKPETGLDVESKRKNDVIEQDDSELVDFEADNLENSEEDRKELVNPIKKNIVEYQPNRRKQNGITLRARSSSGLNKNQDKEKNSRHKKKASS